jgi:hypothetical protein
MSIADKLAEKYAPEYMTAFATPHPSALSTQVAGDHYQMAIQPVEFITKNKLTFLEGCVVKRVCRHRRKNGKEDLLKAIHELQLMIELEYPDAE